MVCGLFLDYGDAIVAEEYTYPQALDCNLAPRGARVLPAAMDERGLVPEALEEVRRALYGAGRPSILVCDVLCNASLLGCFDMNWSDG